MKRLLMSALLTLGLTGAAHSAVIATLQEADNDTVLFSLEVTNPAGFDYSGFGARHLEYMFFDNLGDYVDGPALGNNNNPTIFQPTSHGLVGTSTDGFTIGIQAIVLDNDDDNNPNDEDDFALRFIGQTPGLTNGVTPLNFEEMVNYDPVLIRNLSFSVLKEGTYFSNSSRASAVGGFTLQVNALSPVPVPLPATLPLLAGGLIAAGAFVARRRKRASE
ncbi:MAG: VPLPA-CTERM sorting domain-containing protein [Pseudomonadota bacterium]